MFAWHYDIEDDFSHHIFNSLNHQDINTQDTLITLNMNSKECGKIIIINILIKKYEQIVD